MDLITDNTLYNGGEKEVSILNELAQYIWSAMKVGDNCAKVVCTGVQNAMEISALRYNGDETIELNISSWKKKILKLREVSKGYNGAPWFKFELTIRFGEEIEVWYDWAHEVNTPTINDFEKDLKLFPRENKALPPWYPVAA